MEPRTHFLDDAHTSLDWRTFKAKTSPPDRLPEATLSPGSLSVTPQVPDRDCPLCPRLRDYRAANWAAHPDWHNAPVPSFGDLDASLLVVGLAPGVRGRTAPGARSPGISLAYCCTRRCRGSVSPLGSTPPRRTMGSVCGHAGSPTPYAACRRATCQQRPRSQPAIRFSPPKSRRCRICAASSLWGWSPIKPCCERKDCVRAIPCFSTARCTFCRTDYCSLTATTCRD